MPAELDTALQRQQQQKVQQLQAKPTFGMQSHSAIHPASSAEDFLW
jgi:hypothetical protein